jgi:hypothetical protein
VGARSPVERPEEEQRISCRGKAFWAGKSFTASRRWGGSGLGDSQRIGTRAPRKARTGIEEDRDRDVRGSVERRSWVRTKTPPRYVLDPPKRFGAS